MSKVILAKGLPHRGDIKIFRERAKTALDSFINDFMSNQEKIEKASDLVPGLLYEYISGASGCVIRCILWSGIGKRAAKMIGDNPDYDAQINIEVEPAEYDGGSFVFIAQHKEDTEFLDLKNWRLLD